MIKVAYVGYGVYYNVDSGGGYYVDKSKVERLTLKHYLLTTHDKLVLREFGSTSIEMLKVAELDRVIVILTDEQGNPAPIEITKGKVEYRSENGNKLNVFFDDAPLDDVAPTEKPSLLNIPTRQDSWFEVINEMVNKFHAENGAIPTATQAWNLLYTQPPAGYAITTGKDKGGEACLIMAGKSLGKSAFGKRWKSYIE